MRHCSFALAVLFGLLCVLNFSLAIPSSVTSQVCNGEDLAAGYGAYRYPVFDLPNQGSGAFAFSQVGLPPPSLDKRIAEFAGRQGIYRNGTYPAWVRNTNLTLGWDITVNVALAYENVREMVECVGGNFSTDVIYARSEFSTFGIDEFPSGVVKNSTTGQYFRIRDLPTETAAILDPVLVKDLPRALKNEGYVQWRTIINTLRRAYIPQPRLMDPRTLVSVEWLVGGAPFEYTVRALVPRCFTTCKDRQVAAAQAA